MSIPEHNKCVALHKRLRHDNQKGNWRRVRAIRRKIGKIKPKMRIRQIHKVEFEMQKSRVKKQFNIGYTEFMKSVIGKHYRKWGKYDD